MCQRNSSVIMMTSLPSVFKVIVSCEAFSVESFSLSFSNPSIPSSLIPPQGYVVGGFVQGNGHPCPLMYDSVDHWQSSVVVLVFQHHKLSNALSWAPFGAGGGLPLGTFSLLPPSRSQLPSIYTCAT